MNTAFRPLVIGMTYDLKTEYIFQAGDPVDANAEFDHPLTVGVIADALIAMGHQPVRIGHVHQLLSQLDRLEVDVVFNIAEGRGSRNREAQVPILLELQKIPTIGSDALTLALTLDKGMTKKVLMADGIPTPKFFSVHQLDDPLPADLKFPLIVKPQHEGSSKGISEKSVVHSLAELKAQIAWVIETYCQPAVIEEFIQGTEFTIAIIGNQPAPEALPVVQIRIDGKDDLGDLFYTFSRIASGADYFCPTNLDPKLERTLKEMALRTYRAVDCLDFGRVDIRVDRQGNPYVLEINPLPSLSTEDVFSIVGNRMGLTYEQMIARIVNAGIERLKLAGRPAAKRARTMAHQHR